MCDYGEKSMGLSILQLWPDVVEYLILKGQCEPEKIQYQYGLQKIDLELSITNIIQYRSRKMQFKFI